MGAPRWLELDGTANCRELGGLPLHGGGSTRSGVLLRSDALHDLTDADVALLTGTWGVRHVIDLRAAGERAERGRGRLAAAGVCYSELEVFSDAVLAERRAAHAGAGTLTESDSMADAYRFFLEVGAAAFVTALARLAEPDGAPAIVHCAAGKDRTGVLVALLLDVAGVRPEAIVEDYAATAHRLDGIRAKLSALSSYARFAAEAPATAAAMSADASTMAELLEWLHAEHGGAAGWFRAAGAPEAHLNAWAVRLAG
ncbi:MAG: tyrosine-protein phosphatase [Acidimicrobiales bacterium]